MNDFIKHWLNEAQKGTVSISRGESSKETKYLYHGIIETNLEQLVIFIGDENTGDNFSWGFEINKEQRDEYI